MRLRTLTLPGQPNADGVQPYLLVLDDGNRTVSLDEIDELPARPDLGGCQGLVAFGYRVDIDGDQVTGNPTPDAAPTLIHDYDCDTDHDTGSCKAHAAYQESRGRLQQMADAQQRCSDRHAITGGRLAGTEVTCDLEPGHDGQHFYRLLHGDLRWN